MQHVDQFRRKGKLDRLPILMLPVLMLPVLMLPVLMLPVLMLPVLMRWDRVKLPHDSLDGDVGIAFQPLQQLEITTNKLSVKTGRI
jgi:hypothetical protein